MTAGKLHDRGIETVGEVAQLGETVLVSRFSGAAPAGTCTRSRTIAIRGRCRSDGAGDRSARSARSGARRKSPEVIDASLVTLVDRVARRLRAAGRECRTVVLRFRFDDFTRATRSHTLPRATAHTRTILAIARGLLAEAEPMIERQGLTLIGISLANLDDDDVVQLALPFDRAGGGALDAAVDDVRDRYGSGAVTRAGLLGHDPGLTMPMLPD